VPSPAGFPDLLADLTRCLTRLSVPWCVFGAQAALLWGRPRLTRVLPLAHHASGLAVDVVLAGLGLVGTSASLPQTIKLSDQRPRASAAAPPKPAAQDDDKSVRRG
jgi:hypothetical protein